MNNKLGLAVAGAVLALSSAAQAGITIPAGDWTIDISGNVNAYYQNTRASGGDWAAAEVSGGVAGGRDANGDRVANGINTGLLPSWIGFSGKTRQNDLDVAFTISFQPQVSDNGPTGDGAAGASSNSQFLNRQTFLTFGDASWGSVKLGKDLGIFASDAILSDMTLLGVGAGSGISGSPINTTLGGIGTGYMYAAWKGQIAYTTPNFNGFQATVALTNPNQGFDSVNMDRLGFEGKASYSWTGDVAGKVWASYASYDVTTAAVAPANWTCSAQNDGLGALSGSATECAATRTVAAGTLGSDSTSYTASAYDIGANVNTGNLGLTAYYYNGRGAGTTLFGSLGADANGKKRDSHGGYVQATYVIPTGTKLGVSYGVSKLDDTAADRSAGVALVESNRRWTVGAYHPLTKSLNLVAEYNDVKSEAQNYVDVADAKSKNVSLGAILFF